MKVTINKNTNLVKFSTIKPGEVVSHGDIATSTLWLKVYNPLNTSVNVFNLANGVYGLIYDNEDVILVNAELVVS